MGDRGTGRSEAWDSPKDVRSDGGAHKFDLNQAPQLLVGFIVTLPAASTPGCVPELLSSSVVCPQDFAMRLLGSTHRDSDIVRGRTVGGWSEHLLVRSVPSRI